MDKPSKINETLIIGLTGNIATGKSAVGQLAAKQGAFTIDADQVVHNLLNSNQAVQQSIGEAFGAGVRLDDGSINRPALGSIVFNDPEALKQLENIVHPAVYETVIALLNGSKSKVILYEAIKLLESKFRAHCHHIWVTTCSRQKQLQRLQTYRGMDEKTALARIKAQSPQEEKIAAADVVIDTNGSMQHTEEQFRKAWSALKL